MAKLSTSKTYVIAEAGCEHAGSIERAKELIDVATYAEADCVKFQLFYPEEVGEKVWNRIKDFHLSASGMNVLRSYAKNLGIDFLCSAFGMHSLEEISAMGCKAVKVPAPCNENIEYLVDAVRRFNKVFVSLGMCTGDQFYTILERTPWPDRKTIEFLHCTSAYPCPYDQVNLNVLNTTWKGSLIYSGLSDHTLGINIPLAAVALGARVIEKHFTLGYGPDADMALTPEELLGMVRGIRQVEQAMGDGIKRIEESERELLCRKTL